MMIQPDTKEERLLTVEERQQALDRMAELVRISDEIMARHGGGPFTPESWELLNEARDERDRELL